MLHQEFIMDKAQLLGEIRSLVRQTLARHGASLERPFGEAMLIHNGYFCGRRFESGGFQAIWFLEENEIKFYDPSGALLQVLNLTAEELDRRKAA